MINEQAFSKSQFWDEICYGRPHGSYLNVVEQFQEKSMDSVAIGFHLIVVTRPLRISGYQFRGQNISASDWRLWINRSHEMTGLPYGPAIEFSDTSRHVNSATATLSEINPACPLIEAVGSVPSDIETVTLVLPNVLFIDTPGVYWIGIAHDNSTKTGLLAQSRTIGSRKSESRRG